MFIHLDFHILTVQRKGSSLLLLSNCINMMLLIGEWHFMLLRSTNCPCLGKMHCKILMQLPIIKRYIWVNLLSLCQFCILRFLNVLLILVFLLQERWSDQAGATDGRVPPSSQSHPCTSQSCCSRVWRCHAVSSRHAFGGEYLHSTR